MLSNRSFVFLRCVSYLVIAAILPCTATLKGFPQREGRPMYIVSGSLFHESSERSFRLIRRDDLVRER